MLRAWLAAHCPERGCSEGANHTRSAPRREAHGMSILRDDRPQPKRTEREPQIEGRAIPAHDEPPGRRRRSGRQGYADGDERDAADHTEDGDQQE